MTLGKNFFSGLISSVWSAVANICAIPLYLEYLGMEAYGLIGFFVTTQSVLILLDFGLAPTINREISRCMASGCIGKGRDLLYSLSFIYWSIALLIAIVMWLLSSFIAGYWLNIDSLSKNEVQTAVAMMGLVLACRWPIGLYQGALMGAQKLTIVSGISIVMVTLGVGGAIIILAFISPTIHAFFMWQAAIAICHVMVIRGFAWNILGSKGRRFDIDGLRRIWRFSLGMSGVAASGVILMQLDKVLLSRILSLEDFGRYTLATVVASGLYMILTPAFNTIYPRISAMVAKKCNIENFYRIGSRLLCCVIFPVAASAAFYSEDLVYVWTGDSAVASTVAPVVSLFIIGTSLNGAMHFPYALQLAYGNAKLPLFINSILIVVSIPLIIYLATTYGPIGGAMSWVVVNALYLFVGTWITHRYILIGLGVKWLFIDVFAPLTASLAVIFACSELVHRSDFSHLVNLGFSVTVGLLMIAFLVSASLKDLNKLGLRFSLRFITDTKKA